MDEKAGLCVTPSDFERVSGVSRETYDRLRAMDCMLMDWSARHNLVAKSTIESRWERHYFDSAQLIALLPPAPRSIADLGSGAGFPGLVLAAALPKTNVILIESTTKKAAFLQAAVDAMALRNVVIENARIESVALPEPPEIITARALARLEKLLAYGAGIQGQNTKYFLLKGQDVEVELTEAAKSWHMDVKRHQSRSDPKATILEISEVKRGK